LGGELIETGWGGLFMGTASILRLFFVHAVEGPAWECGIEKASFASSLYSQEQQRLLVNSKIDADKRIARTSSIDGATKHCPLGQLSANEA